MRSINLKNEEAMARDGTQRKRKKKEKKKKKQRQRFTQRRCEVLKRAPALFSAATGKQISDHLPPSCLCFYTNACLNLAQLFVLLETENNITQNICSW
jgi:hypothetical protein